MKSRVYKKKCEIESRLLNKLHIWYQNGCDKNSDKYTKLWNKWYKYYKFLYKQHI